jgi:hypothetical protein
MRHERSSIRKRRFSSSSLRRGGTYARNEETGQKGHQVQTDAEEQNGKKEACQKDQKEVVT